MNGRVIAICENMIAGFDQHMADTYDVPSALNEIITRCKSAEHRADELTAALETMRKRYSDLKVLDDAVIDRLTPERDELTAQLGEIRMLLNAADDETTAQAATRIVDLLATARAERDAAYRVLRSIRGWARLETPDPHEREAFVAWCDQALPEDQRLAAFERTAPLDWRTDDETPLGQMLDGMGDEVE